MNKFFFDDNENGMDKEFSAQVDKIISVNKDRMNALMRESTQRVIDDAQTPTGKGGRMRVDTGFLRASGQLSLGGMPSGPVRGDPEKSYTFEGGTVSLTLAGAELGNSLFFGWSANYAQYRETYDGFLSNAVSKWPKIVETVTEEIKRKIGL